jgi:signal transduction histidine kinase
MWRRAPRRTLCGEVRRTQGQSEQQVERQTRTALAVHLGLLTAFFAGALAADVATRAPAGWLVLLIVLGVLAIAAAARLLARLPAEMRTLAGERRRVLDDLLRSEDIERERIATELHDDTIQVIIAALVTIDRVTPALRAHDTERIAQTLPRARKMLADAVERVRRLTFDLHPPLLGTHGLSVALADLIDRAARDAHIETDVVVELGRYPFVVEDLTYRVVREAIADARAHADTTRVEIDVREHRGVVHGRVWDDGANEPARRPEDRPRVLLHRSLEQLGERVRLADGDLDIRSVPGGGTLVAFRMPIADPAAQVNEPAAAVG